MNEGDLQGPAVRQCNICGVLYQDWRKIQACDDCDRMIRRQKKWDQYNRKEKDDGSKSIL